MHRLNADQHFIGRQECQRPLYHGLRRAELCALRLVDLQDRRGVRHLQVHGKGSKIRYVPLHPATPARSRPTSRRPAIATRRQCRCSGREQQHARRACDHARRRLQGAHQKYAGIVSIEVEGFGPHALRATAATNALDHDADIAKVQQWLGHANISTTRVYDRRQMRAEDSPTFRVVY